MRTTTADATAGSSTGACPHGAPVPFADVVQAAVRQVGTTSTRWIDVTVTPGVPAVLDADTHLRILVDLLGHAVGSCEADAPVQVLATHHGHEVAVEIVAAGAGDPARHDVPGRGPALGPGPGLGLVQGLVARIGGTLSLSCTPQVGTAIGYVAPAARATPVAPAPSGAR